MTLIEIAEQFLLAVKGDLDPYTTPNSIIDKESETKISLFTPDYVQFAAYGRGPGKQPPVGAIVEWLERKGTISDEKERLGTAWAIAKQIKEKGTVNYVPNAPLVMEEAINKHYETYLRASLDAFTLSIYEEIRFKSSRWFPPKLTT